MAALGPGVEIKPSRLIHLVVADSVETGLAGKELSTHPAASELRAVLRMITSFKAAAFLGAAK